MIAVVDYHKGNLKSVERGLVCAGADARITDDIDVIARADGIVLPGVGAFADASAAMFELGQTEVIRRRIDEGVPFLGICIGLHLMFEEGEEGEQVTAEDEEPLRPRGLAILPGVVGRLPKTDTQGKTYKIPHVGWNTIVPLVANATSGILGVAGTSGTPSCTSASTGRIEVQPCLASAQSEAPDAPSLTEFDMQDIPVDTPEPPDAEEVLENTPNEEIETRQCSVAQTVPGFVDTPEPSDPDAEEALEVSIEESTFACPLLAGIKVGEYFYFTHSYAVPTGPFVVAETTHSTTFPSVVQYRDVAFGVQFHPEKSSDAGIQVLRNFVNIVQGA